MQSQRILVGELQLGQRLNQCVSEGKKGEFDLLLSMLSNDVCDQDQFSIGNEKQDEQSISLRESLQVPVPQTLQADNQQQGDYSLSLAKMALDEGLTAARLQHCLVPEALSFTIDKTHGIDSLVFESLSPTVAQRFTNVKQAPNNLTVNVDELIAAQQSYQAQLITA